MSDKLTGTKVSLSEMLPTDKLTHFGELSEISTGYTLPETKNIFKFEVLAQILRIGTEFVPFQNGGLVPEHRNHPLE